MIYFCPHRGRFPVFWKTPIKPSASQQSTVPEWWAEDTMFRTRMLFPALCGGKRRLHGTEESSMQRQLFAGAVFVGTGFSCLENEGLVLIWEAQKSFRQDSWCFHKPRDVATEMNYRVWDGGSSHPCMSILREAFELNNVRRWCAFSWLEARHLCYVCMLFYFAWQITLLLNKYDRFCLFLLFQFRIIPTPLHFPVCICTHHIKSSCQCCMSD